MTSYHNGPIEDLIGPDRVHKSVYTDPAIFDLEMERLFGRTWLYVGHESQVASLGDYLTTTLGTQPVVMSRHQDGEIYVVYNRCGHRGALVCNEASGNTEKFQCCYHGWRFKLNGDVDYIPLRKGYPRDFDLKGPEFGMVRLPRVANYRGFVFASHASDGPDIETFLGPIRQSIDGMVDAAPDGEIDLCGGVHRYQFVGNWKYQVENIIDLYHPPFSHESTLLDGGRQFERAGVEDGAQMLDRKGQPVSAFDNTGLKVFPNGHSFIGLLPNANIEAAPAFEEYKAALEARHGPERTAEILDVDRHNTMIYPNLVIQTASQHVRVVEPIAVDRTIIRIYPIRLKGAPEAMYGDVIRYLNYTHSPAALIQTDDMEAFRRIQVALNTQGAEWVVVGRGLGEEIPDNEGGWSAEGTSEICIRNQFAAWLDHMTSEA